MHTLAGAIQGADVLLDTASLMPSTLLGVGSQTVSTPGVREMPNTATAGPDQRVAEYLYSWRGDRTSLQLASKVDQPMFSTSGAEMHAQRVLGLSHDLWGGAALPSKKTV